MKKLIFLPDLCNFFFFTDLGCELYLRVPIVKARHYRMLPSCLDQRHISQPLVQIRPMGSSQGRAVEKMVMLLEINTSRFHKRNKLPRSNLY